jgi:serine/threonine protein kinase
LLAGYPPFNSENDAMLYRKIKLCDYEFHEETWSEISQDAIHFIKRLIEPNKNKRMKPREALKHPWIVKHTINSSRFDVDILDKLRKA